MFVSLPDVRLSDPRDLSMPLGPRIDSLLAGQKKIAWLYENPDTSTFRYRVLNMIEGVRASHSADIGATWFSSTELQMVEDIVHKLDVLVLARYRYSGALHHLVLRARRAGVRVIFESDDLVFDVRYAALVADTLAQDLKASSIWDAWFAYMGRLNAAAQLCDTGVATNSYLAERMANSFNAMPVAIVPNFLNRDQQHYSSELLIAKRNSGWRRDKNITIGYFSGSPTHVKDFAIAAPALARLLRRHPDVRIRVAGYLDSTGQLRDYVDRVEVLRHMDYVALQRAIAQVEINIAPLQENEFTNCKSELKFFEAAAVGTWTIATPTSTFRQSIHDGVTGRLARAHEWDDALEEAVALVREMADYSTRAEAAATHVHQIYGWNQQAGCIRAAFLDC